MSIAKLLAGTASEAVDMNVVRTFLRDQGGAQRKINKQVRKFAQRAEQSEIGGKGVGFEDMTMSQQQQFILGDTSHVARKMRKAQENYTGPTSTYVPDTTLGAGANPSTADLLRIVGGGFGDAVKGAVSNVAGIGAGVRDAITNTARETASAAGDMAVDALIHTVGAGVDLVLGAEKLVYGAGRAAKGTADFAVGAAKGTADLLNQAGNSKIVRAVAGDTSGRAAAEAGQNFQQSYRNVFSSEATAEAFGVERDVLRQAFDQTGDEFTATLKAGNLDEKAIEGLEAFRGEVKRVADEGGNLSEEGMQAMLTNTGEVGNMYAGFSRAGATASPNALLRGMAGEGTGMESVMGIAAVAGLAGGANVMMGGDFTEGAAVGGIGAMSIRGIAKGVAGSMGDIEQSMIKSILGDEKPMQKTMQQEGTLSLPKGTKLSEIGAEFDDRLLSDVFEQSQLRGIGLDAGATVGAAKKNPIHHVGRGEQTKTTMGIDEPIMKEVEQELTGGAARKHQLQTIKDMKDDDERLQGFGKKKMRDLLNPNKEKNVAMNNRALVLGGGMLSGVAFTGNADRRDYRRGFNAHRGNRI